LCNNEGHIDEIFNFLNDKNHNDNFLHDGSLVELNPIIVLVKNNKVKIDEFYNFLVTYYLITNGKLELKPTNINNIIIILENRIDINGKSAFAYLISVWFVHTFANYNILNVEMIDDKF
jgi:hypothetical protein